MTTSCKSNKCWLGCRDYDSVLSLQVTQDGLLVKRLLCARMKADTASCDTMAGAKEENLAKLKNIGNTFTQNV